MLRKPTPYVAKLEDLWERDKEWEYPFVERKESNFAPTQDWLFRKRKPITKFKCKRKS